MATIVFIFLNSAITGKIIFWRESDKVFDILPLLSAEMYLDMLEFKMSENVSENFIIRKFEAGATFDNSFFDNCFGFL